MLNCKRDKISRLLIIWEKNYNVELVHTTRFYLLEDIPWAKCKIVYADVPAGMWLPIVGIIVALSCAESKPVARNATLSHILRFKLMKYLDTWVILFVHFGFTFYLYFYP